MKATLLGFAVLIASTAIAAPPKRVDDFVEIKAGTPVTIRPDRAYLLFRTNSKETRAYVGISPVFLRIPTTEEMQAYDAAKQNAARSRKPSDHSDFVYDEIRNIDSLRLARALEKSDDGRVMLIEALPGDYVLYGWGQADMLVTCLCLGTVSFAANAGTITDLGTLLVAPAADPSPIPELKAVTGLGATMNGHVVTLASAIRVANDSTPIPAAVAGKPIVRAQYRATGKFVSPFTFTINRLAPLPGILGYDRGAVLDLVTGTVADDHYY
ncbi:MAG TPA: hypothetical protein VJZ00_07835 [Thermoanaerobaculia bacterium]|nr:hypothetical protein [Thermoanaerobaculia bacterium]